MEKELDILNRIGKRMPYTTPDDFFDKMEENVVATLSEKGTVRSATLGDACSEGLKNGEKLATATSGKPKSHKRTLHITLRSVLAVAATVALFFVVQPLFTKNDTVDFESVELAFNNLSVDDQDYLLAIYENDEFINYLTNTENEE